MPIHPTPLRHKPHLPRQRPLRRPRRPHTATHLPPLLPLLQLRPINPIPMQPQLQLKRQLDHRHRPLRQIPRIQNHHIIPEHIQMILQRNQIPIPLLRTPPPRNKRRLLPRRRRPRPHRIPRPPLPRKMAQNIKQPARRRPALGRVVKPRPVHLRLPEVVVRLGDAAVVDARELAVDLEDGGGRDAVAGLVGLGVEEPAVGGAGELVALGEAVRRGVDVVGREEEEDVAVGDGEVEDDAARGVFVAAGDVAVEGF